MSESKCALCGEATLIKYDRNIVEGSGKFNPKIELPSLELPFHLPFCKYICRNSVDILKRRKKLREGLEEVNKQIHEKHSCCFKYKTRAFLQGQLKLICYQGLQAFSFIAMCVSRIGLKHIRRATM